MSLIKDLKTCLSRFLFFMSTCALFKDVANRKEKSINSTVRLKLCFMANDFKL